MSDSSSADNLIKTEANKPGALVTSNEAEDIASDIVPPTEEIKKPLTIPKAPEKNIVPVKLTQLGKLAKLRTPKPVEKSPTEVIKTISKAPDSSGVQSPSPTVIEDRKDESPDRIEVLETAIKDEDPVETEKLV